MKNWINMVILAVLSFAAVEAKAAIQQIQVDELGNMVVRFTGGTETLYRNRDGLSSDVGLPGSVGTVLSYDLSGIVTGLVSGDFVIHEKGQAGPTAEHSDVIRFLAKGFTSTVGTHTFTSDHDQLFFYSDDQVTLPVPTGGTLSNLVDFSANQESQGANGVSHAEWNPNAGEPGVFTNGVGNGHWDFWSEGNLAPTHTPEPSSLVAWSGLCAVGAVMAYRRRRRASCASTMASVV